LKRSAVLIFVLLIFIFMFVAVGCNKTVAKVDGADIKQKEVDAYINFIKSQSTDEQLIESEEEMGALEANIIDSLIVIELLEDYAQENNITVSGQEVDEQLGLIIDSYPSEEDFEKKLEDVGVSREFLGTELRSQILRSKIYNEVTAGIDVTDKEIKQYYDDNEETLFLVPITVKASHIMAMFPWIEDGSEETEEGRKEALEKIEMVQDKLERGGDFEELAQKYSDDTSTAESGGDLGYISEGQTIEEFEKPLFSLDVGEVSKIIETGYGFHILKVFEREEEHIQKFSEVEESIGTYLLNLHKSEKWEEFILSLIEEANIEYFTDVEGSLASSEKEGE